MQRIDVFAGCKISALLFSRDPIVYIHGSGCDAELWILQKEVGGVALDLPNHGKSSSAEINSVDDYAYYVAEFTKRVFGKATIVGHSLGGAIAQKVYLNYPEVVEKLVLVGTGARLRVLPAILEGLKKEPQKTARFVSEMAFENKELAEKYSEIFEKRVEILLKDLQICDKFDLLEDYRSGKIKIDVPIAVIVGDKDKLTPLKYSEFLKAHCSGELFVLKDAGHMVMLEKPDEFNDILKKLKM